MDTVVDGEVFLLLCDKVYVASKWKLIAEWLKFSDETIKNIQLDNILYKTDLDKLNKVLKQWKLDNGDKATYRKRFKALENTDFVGVIKVVVNYLQEEHD